MGHRKGGKKPGGIFENGVPFREFPVHVCRSVEQFRCRYAQGHGGKKPHRREHGKAASHVGGKNEAAAAYLVGEGPENALLFIGDDHHVLRRFFRAEINLEAVPEEEEVGHGLGGAPRFADDGEDGLLRVDEVPDRPVVGRVNIVGHVESRPLPLRPGKLVPVRGQQRPVEHEVPQGRSADAHLDKSVETRNPLSGLLNVGDIPARQIEPAHTFPPFGSGFPKAGVSSPEYFLVSFDGFDIHRAAGREGFAVAHRHPIGQREKFRSCSPSSRHDVNPFLSGYLSCFASSASMASGLYPTMYFSPICVTGTPIWPVFFTISIAASRLACTSTFS
ncbi:hypothetical protein SDC9_52979 [bioreactor metagenome]|uniref:Uncharacterized protein n=1 Tax=bioreactor metagenome TaxID=1076179 RepID=A0A644WSN1_9ZZZZ